ncbi:MAG: UdgX family uracil-DNA binding protein [Reyranellaceae bacterium]
MDAVRRGGRLPSGRQRAGPARPAPQTRRAGGAGKPVLIAVSLRPGADLDGFRAAVRGLAARQMPPTQVAWSDAGTPDLLGEARVGDGPPLLLPRRLARLIEIVVCHRDPERHALLYQAIWRILHGERALLDTASDPLVHRLEAMRAAVLRDRHKMTAFVRFREIAGPDGSARHVAWFEPEHFILGLVADFFVERFAGMLWSILTPNGSLHWDGDALAFGPPASRADAPEGDPAEAAWRAYYESVFNAARVNPQAMSRQMPRKYWRNLPEAAAIPQLVRTASQTSREMLTGGATVTLKRDPIKAVAAMAEQAPRTLEDLNRHIEASPPLSPGADRAVLGEGPLGADIAFVGEQPGDQEEQLGRPFVGPAGQLLDTVLKEVGIDRRRVYVTNAVKHFKFEPRGKRRLHKNPSVAEVKRYRWWLHQELALVRPRFVVALGGTAVLALTGEKLAVSRVRGARDLAGFRGYVTVHPSYLLRLPDEPARQSALAAFRDDLVEVRALAAD